MKHFYIGNCSRWMVVKAANIAQARREAKDEFGKSYGLEIRLATDDEVRQYAAQRTISESDL